MRMGRTDSDMLRREAGHGMDVRSDRVSIFDRKFHGVDLNQNRAGCSITYSKCLCVETVKHAGARPFHKIAGNIRAERRRDFFFIKPALQHSRVSFLRKKCASASADICRRRSGGIKYCNSGEPACRSWRTSLPQDLRLQFWRLPALLYGSACH